MYNRTEQLSNMDYGGIAYSSMAPWYLHRENFVKSNFAIQHASKLTLFQKTATAIRKVAISEYDNSRYRYLKIRQENKGHHSLGNQTILYYKNAIVPSVKKSFL